MLEGNEDNVAKKNDKKYVFYLQCFRTVIELPKSKYLCT